MAEKTALSIGGGEAALPEPSGAERAFAVSAAAAEAPARTGVRPRVITRRTALGLTLAGAGAVLLAACGPGSVPPPPDDDDTDTPADDDTATDDDTTDDDTASDDDTATDDDTETPADDDTDTPLTPEEIDALLAAAAPAAPTVDTDADGRVTATGASVLLTGTYDTAKTASVTVFKESEALAPVLHDDGTWELEITGLLPNTPITVSADATGFIPEELRDTELTPEQLARLTVSGPEAAVEWADRTPPPPPAVESPYLEGGMMSLPAGVTESSVSVLAGRMTDTYLLEYRVNGTGAWQTVPDYVAQTEGSSLPVTVPNSYEVRACDNAGNSSAPYAFLVAELPPVAPAVLTRETVLSPDQTAFELTLQLAPGTAGLYYTKPDGTRVDIDPALLGDGSGNPVTLTVEAPDVPVQGETYVYEFVALNRSGEPHSGAPVAYSVRVDVLPPGAPAVNREVFLLHPDDTAFDLEVTLGSNTAALLLEDPAGHRTAVDLTGFAAGDTVPLNVPLSASDAYGKWQVVARNTEGEETATQIDVRVDIPAPAAPTLNVSSVTLSPADTNFNVEVTLGRFTAGLYVLNPNGTRTDIDLAGYTSGMPLPVNLSVPAEGGPVGNWSFVAVNGEGEESVTVLPVSIDYPPPTAPDFANTEEVIPTIGGNNRVELTFTLGANTVGVTYTTPDGTEVPVDLTGKNPGDTVSVLVEGAEGTDLSGLYRFTAVNTDGDTAESEVTLDYAEVFLDGSPVSLDLNQPLVKTVTLKGVGGGAGGATGGVVTGITVYRGTGEGRVDVFSQDIPEDAVMNEDGSVTFDVQIPITGGDAVYPQETPVETYVIQAYSNAGVPVAEGETGVEVTMNGPEVGEIDIDDEYTGGYIGSGYDYEVTVPVQNATSYEIRLELPLEQQRGDLTPGSIFNEIQETNSITFTWTGGSGGTDPVITMIADGPGGHDEVSIQRHVY